MMGFFTCLIILLDLLLTSSKQLTNAPLFNIWNWPLLALKLLVNQLSDYFKTCENGGISVKITASLE